MIVKTLSDSFLLKGRDDIIKVHLYLKLLQNNIKPIDNDISIICELYKFGGYNNAKEQSIFIKHCIDMNLRKSEQSLRNALSKYVIRGVFKKDKNCSLYLKDDYLPKIEFDKLILKYTLSHAE